MWVKTVIPLLKPEKWGAREGQITDLMKLVRDLKPYHETPLIRAMWKAKGDLVGVKGFKTMLVLTDGADNLFSRGPDSFGPDPDLNPENKKSIPEFLKEEFMDSGILINVVGFELDSKDQKDAQESFKVLEELKTPGKFRSVDQANDLVANLVQAMRRRLLCRLEWPDGYPVAGQRGGLPVAKLGEDPRPFLFELGEDPRPFLLAPGSYRLRVQDFDPEDVYFRPGDRLLVRLKSSGNKPTFERALFTEFKEAKVVGSPEKQGSWVLAAMQNQLILRNDERLQQALVVLERADQRAPGSRGGALQQVYPQLAWFEVKPDKVTQRVSVQVQRNRQYPAPAWDLSVKQWPAANPSDPKVLVDAWWLAELKPDWVPVPRTPHKTLEQDFTDRAVALDGGERVVVERLTLETPRGKPCLVVRLRFASESNPVLVQVQGLQEGLDQENRLYLKARRTMCVVWNVTREEAEKRDISLALLPLEGFKKKASHLTLKLPPPQPSSEPPDAWTRGDGSTADP
jgi:hypothetical protein